MSRMYSVKAGGRRWPVHVFYNILDMSLINAWVVHKAVTGASISRKQFIQKIVVQLTEARDAAEKPQNKQEPLAAPAKIRRTCSSGKCKRNRTCDVCSMCEKPLCGRCTVFLCPKCK